VEYRVAGTQFYRDNYTAEVNGMNMVQAHFATVKNGYALVFVFIGQDQASLDEMIKSMDTVEFIPVRRGVTTIIDSPPQPKPTPKP
jgi:hypothetical protein